MVDVAAFNDAKSRVLARASDLVGPRATQREALSAMPTTSRESRITSSISSVTAPFLPISRHTGGLSCTGSMSTVLTSELQVVYAPALAAGARTESAAARNLMEPSATWPVGRRRPARNARRMSVTRLAAMIRAIRTGETRDD